MTVLRAASGAAQDPRFPCPGCGAKFHASCTCQRPATAAGQFHRDHKRDLANPEYAEAYHEATAEVSATAAPDVLTREFVLDLLRSLRRAGHCSGIVLSHGTRKRYGDVIRMMEKQEARNV